MGGVNLAMMLFKQALYAYIPAINGSLYVFEALFLLGITKYSGPNIVPELNKNDIEGKV